MHLVVHPITPTTVLKQYAAVNSLLVITIESVS